MKKLLLIFKGISCYERVIQTVDFAHISARNGIRNDEELNKGPTK